MLNNTGGQKPRIVLIYLGRRGALGRFSLEIAKAASEIEECDVELIISANGELAGMFDEKNVTITKIPTFERAASASVVLGFGPARAMIIERLLCTRPQAVITLMPHIWSPLLTPAIKRLGIPYATIVHDAAPHPGDPTAAVTGWLLRDAHHADLVITLSRAVAERLLGRGRVKASRILPLFHPDLLFESSLAYRERDLNRPFRLLFFGRILPYKGLGLLIDAIEILRSEGVEIHLGVAGSGDIGDDMLRLQALGAEVINRWIKDEEVGAILARYDAMACSHVEASQSGVAATAFGNCMPVVAMPVGGIAEQVVDGKTGILARRISARSFADAVYRLVSEDSSYENITKYLSETANDRSMDRFLSELISEVLPLAQPSVSSPHDGHQ